MTAEERLAIPVTPGDHAFQIVAPLNEMLARRNQRARNQQIMLEDLDMVRQMQNAIATALRDHASAAVEVEREHVVGIIREAQEMIRSHSSINETTRGSIEMMLAVMADEIRARSEGGGDG